MSSSHTSNVQQNDFLNHVGCLIDGQVCQHVARCMAAAARPEAGPIPRVPAAPSTPSAAGATEDTATADACYHYCTAEHSASAGAGPAKAAGVALLRTWRTPPP